jgi:hypothetical protein
MREKIAPQPGSPPKILVLSNTYIFHSDASLTPPEGYPDIFLTPKSGRGAPAREMTRKRERIAIRAQLPISEISLNF